MKIFSKSEIILNLTFNNKDEIKTFYHLLTAAEFGNTMLFPFSNEVEKLNNKLQQEILPLINSKQ